MENKFNPCLSINGLFAQSRRCAKKIILGISRICLRLFFSHALILNKNPYFWTDTNPNYPKLEQALKRAYRDRAVNGSVEPGKMWQTGVMRRIRVAGPQLREPDFFSGLGQIAWRLAPATFALVMLFFVLLLQLDFVPDYQLAQIFLPDVAGLSLENTFVM